jgi:hypothetical protein
MKMPKISEMKSSKFLKRDDVGDGVVCTITGVSQENVAKEGADPEMKWCLHFANLDKPMVLNSTNMQLIAKFTGSEDTDDWEDKKIILYDDPSVSFGGKLTGGIRVRQYKGKESIKTSEDTTQDMQGGDPF